MITQAFAALSTWLVMGTTVQIDPGACLSSRQVLEVLQKTEARYSTWTDRSELSRLNRERKLAPGSTLEAELTRVMALSQKWKDAFHPGLGKWVMASQVRQGKSPRVEALRTLGVPPPVVGTSLEAALANPRWDFEEGGFAKGLALDLARAALPRPDCNLSINLGGQVLSSGRTSTIRIASPRKRSEAWIELEVRDASLATSGQSEQPGHILDPRTGLPSPLEGSATVIHPSALEADIAATAIAVLGPDSAVIPKEIDWIYVFPDGRVTAPARLRDHYRVKSLKSLRWTWL